MINHLDNLLLNLFLTRIADLTIEAQVGFQPPDEDWRGKVQGQLGDQVALNVYLADLRENRKLRSNAHSRTIESGLVHDQPAPVRLDCHYLITAWSPATEEVGKTTDEHALLYQATAALTQSAPLNPSRIYPPGSIALAGVPELIRHADLPTQILPVEGFPKLAEFWGTMGKDHRWKPSIYLIVTLPVALPVAFAGLMVTTRVTEYRRTGHPETAEVWAQIGGHVLDSAGEPVVGAWVQIETTGGEPLQATETDGLGRFTFADLQPGQYQLRWRAMGHPVPPSPREIEIPSPTGEYDLRF